MRVRVTNRRIYCGLLRLFYIMDIFSLEEDDGNELFLTQSKSDSADLRNYSQNISILGDPLDFKSPCASLVSRSQTQYSDISEDDFEDIPSSQIQTKTVGESTRCVLIVY